MAQPTRAVLLIGDLRLREVSKEVEDVHNEHFVEEREDLKRALEEFRRKNGFGRAISAPQLGFNKRFIACNFGKGTFTMINPKITWKSEETMTLFDDCMSFPWLMVKVRRHKSISVDYTDEQNQPVTLSQLDPSLSELLQHEIDHLDGVLATDLAIDKDSFVARDVYEKDKGSFDAQVDYYIVPTL